MAWALMMIRLDCACRKMRVSRMTGIFSESMMSRRTFPASHTRQLVNVAHQHQAHVLRNRLHQIIHQDDVYHRTLIHDQRITLQRVLLVALVSVLRIKLQQPVDGLGFHARGLAHSLGSSARRKPPAESSSLPFCKQK